MRQKKNKQDFAQYKWMLHHAMLHHTTGYEDAHKWHMRTILTRDNENLIKAQMNNGRTSME